MEHVTENKVTKVCSVASTSFLYFIILLNILLYNKFMTGYKNGTDGEGVSLEVQDWPATARATAQPPLLERLGSDHV